MPWCPIPISWRPSNHSSINVTIDIYGYLRSPGTDHVKYVPFKEMSIAEGAKIGLALRIRHPFLVLMRCTIDRLTPSGERVSSRVPNAVWEEMGHAAK